MTETMQLSKIEVETNIRTTTNKEADAELLSSVKRDGILQPLLVRKLDGGVKFGLVAGHRRYAAAKAAGIKEVPIRIVEAKTDAEKDNIRLVENVQRLDLNVMEEALAYKHMMDRGGKDVWAHVGKQVLPNAAYQSALTGLAKMTGKTESHIAKVVRLTELELEYQELLQDGTLTLQHGMLILSVDPAKRKVIYEEIKRQRESFYGKVDAQFTTSGLMRIIDEKVKRSLSSAVFPKDRTYGDLIPCTVCPYNTDNTKDLFGMVGSEKGLCRNSKCFKIKTDTFWRLTRQEQQKKLGDLKFLGYLREGFGVPKEQAGLELTPKNGEGAEGWFLLKADKPQVIFGFKPTGKKAEEMQTRQNPESFVRGTFEKQLLPIILRKGVADKAKTVKLNRFKNAVDALLAVAPDMANVAQYLFGKKELNKLNPTELGRVITLRLLLDDVDQQEYKGIDKVCGAGFVAKQTDAIKAMWEKDKAQILADAKKYDAWQATTKYARDNKLS